MKRIKVNYVKSPHFHSGFVTGVYGGLAPNGILNLNFFTDKIQPPASFMVETDDNGVAKPEGATNTAFVRELVVGIEVDISSARIINNWLTQKIQEAEEMKKKLKGTNE
jgi:hypothetical protein